MFTVREAVSQARHLMESWERPAIFVRTRQGRSSNALHNSLTSLLIVVDVVNVPSLFSLTMSGTFRARRPASPPPGGVSPVVHSQRFPHPREEHLDADERRVAASQGFSPSYGRMGKNYPSGGLNITSGEYKLLFFVVLIASGVRLFRLSKPDSIV